MRSTVQFENSKKYESTGRPFGVKRLSCATIYEIGLIRGCAVYGPVSHCAEILVSFFFEINKYSVYRNSGIMNKKTSKQQLRVNTATWLIVFHIQYGNKIRSYPAGLCFPPFLLKKTGSIFVPNLLNHVSTRKFLPY